MTNALYGALLAATTAAPPSSSAALPVAAAVWVWPVQPPLVTRQFIPPPTPYAAGHRGIDLAAVTGQPVAAAGAGVVSFAGYVAGTGVVVVRHGQLRTTYEPVAPGVIAGQRVEAGEVVGRISGGHGGCTVCLHFGLRLGETYLDPMQLFARGPVRLLPVDGPLPAPPAAVAASNRLTPRMIAAAAPAKSARQDPAAADPALALGAAASVGATVTSLAAARSRRRQRNR